VASKSCSGINQGGERCSAKPMRDEEFCFFHHPDHADEADQARKLGGARRKREATLQAAYDFEGLQTFDDLQRLLEIAALDTLSLENSVPRNRVVIAAVMAGAKLRETGEQEERLAAIEAALGPRLQKPDTTRRRR
jgi:hypothetical protein